MKLPGSGLNIHAKHIPIIGMLGLFLVLQTVLIFRFNINWDEYFFLSHIDRFLTGNLTEAMQTFHVRLLAGIAALPLSDPDQITAGRFIMALCELGALVCVYRIAKVVVGSEHALFGPAVWCASGYALTQGMTFRTDPLASFLMMASLNILFAAKPSWRLGAVSGVLSALGILVTVKCVFYLPAFAAALIWRMSDRENRKLIIAMFSAATIALLSAGILLFLWHSIDLAQTALADSSSVAQSMADASSDSERMASKVLFSDGLFPRASYIIRWATFGFLPLIMVLVGMVCALGLLTGKSWSTGSAILLLCAPLASIAFYRNAFPYFFPFIFFPAAIVAALGFASINSPLIQKTILAGMSLMLIIQFIGKWDADQSSQRAIANAVHMTFPEPVPYIDRNGMIPSYRKVGFFMSTWGIEGVLGSNRPALAPVIEKDRPLFVIANSPLLEAALNPSFKWDGPKLGNVDTTALRDNYIHHWGAMWVAGKKLSADNDLFEIVIPGIYTLECSGSRRLDGTRVECGKVQLLNPGKHNWSGGSARWRWGQYLKVPHDPPPVRPIYYGF